MKTEQVPAEWVEVASQASYEASFGAVWEACREKDIWRRDTRHALAAVAPLIAAAERERCAKVAETHEWFVGGVGTVAPGSGQAKAIATAIRAMGDEE